MKLIKLYEEILKENQAEACVVKFGRELFDPQLSISGEPNEVEPNTKIEDEYLEYINNFTGTDSGPVNKSNFIHAIKTLQSCMKVYPDVLQPEGYAYKGTSLPLSSLLLYYEDITDDLSSGGEFTMNYKPKSIIQTWTDNIDTAEGDAIASPTLVKLINKYNGVKSNPEGLNDFVDSIYPELDSIKCPIIIKLITNKDDFLFKGKYFTRLSKFSGKDELLRINDKTTSVTTIIPDFLLDGVHGILTAVKRNLTLKK